MNMIKVLWRRFQKWLGTFTMLLFEGSSETFLFKNLYEYVFEVRIFENTKSMRVIFFLKYLKFKLDFKKGRKNWQKVFCFWDNCIWIGIVKLSLLKTGYFSSAANVLQNSTNILNVNKTDFLQLNWLCRDQWIWQKCCHADFKSAWGRLPCCLLKCPLKRVFLDIHLTTFLEAVNLEIPKLWRSFLFKMFKIYSRFQKRSKKIKKKVFRFADSCIWIGIVKVSLLRTGYLSSAANVLTSSTKIWHVNKRDFFQLNWLATDQWIW